MNYLFLAPEADSYQFFYSDIEKLNSAYYIKTNFKINKILNFIRHVHTSRKVNSMIPMPFKSIWISKFKSKKIVKILSSDETIVFVFRHSFFLFYDYNIDEWMKKVNPKTKFVFLFADIIDSYKKNFNLQVLRKKFDLLVSFDREDCEKFNFLYYPHVITFPTQPSMFYLEKHEEKYDIYFMGRAKNRLNLLIDLFKLFKSKKINVLFEIAGVEEKDRFFIDSNFKYISYIPYKDYLQRCQESSCILEVMQDSEHTGYTTRVLEALSLNKKLISNNMGLIKSPFYSKRMISVFTSLEDIDFSILEDGNESYNYDSQNFSLQNLLTFISSFFRK